MVLTATVSHDVPPLPAGLRSSRRRRVANELNTTAIHALRVARTTDAESGLSPERLSLLSVLVYAGPRTIRIRAAPTGRLPGSAWLAPRSSCAVSCP